MKIKSNVVDNARFNSFTAPACKISGLKTANSIFDGTTTSLHSILCTLIEILLCAHVKGKIGFNNFKFGTFNGRFKSDSAASMAVKGLI